MGPEARSCKPCAASKRKCGKQTPHCLRCRKRGVLCTYPPAKPSSFVLIPNDDEVAAGAGYAANFNSVSHQQQQQQQPQPQPQQQLISLGGYTPPDTSANLDILTPLPSFNDYSSSNSPFLSNGNTSYTTTTTTTPFAHGPWFSAPATWKDATGPLLPDPLRFPVPSYHCYNKYIPRGSLTPPQTPSPPPPDSGTTQVPFDRANLRHHIMVLRGWLAQWVDEGGNQFIHRELYSKPGREGCGGRAGKGGLGAMPRCMQDAYLALSCYLRMTEGKNEDLVFGIVEEKSAGLLREYGVHEDESGAAAALDSEMIEEEGGVLHLQGGLSSLEQIARTQALLVYQFIGLFDGDVRARYVAEGRMDLLARWARGMVEGAECEAWLDGLPPLDVDGEGAQGGRGGGEKEKGGREEEEERTWRSWILAESARRTWVIAGGMRAIFLMMQRRNLPTCTGGLMYTSRMGLWEANSGRDWGRVSSSSPSSDHAGGGGGGADSDLNHNNDVGFVQLAESHKLFSRFRADEVGDFAKFLLGVAFGSEKVKRWGDD